ncbi:MAG: hypothetical protein AAGN82_30340 [Myxococcota bacterium]
MRAWLDALLEKGTAGHPEARMTLLAWAWAMVPQDEVDTSLRLRGLDADFATLDAESLRPLTHAFLRVVSGPSRAKRMSASAHRHEMRPLSRRDLRITYWDWPEPDVLAPPAWRSPVHHAPPGGSWADGPPPLNRPWLAGMSESEALALTIDEHEAIWAAWAGDTETDDAQWPPAHDRPFRPPRIRIRTNAQGVRHPSLRVRHLLLDRRWVRESDVVRMAALQPTRSSLLLAIAQRPQWFRFPRVRHALAQNPYTPSWLAASLLPLLPPRVWRVVVRRVHDPPLQTLARELVRHRAQARPSRPGSRRAENRRDAPEKPSTGDGGLFESR